MMAAHTRLTNAAHAVGTPAYMSPEQATGMVDDIDHHIDQWALACIAWEMLLGAPPFVAEDRTELLYQVIRMEPQPLASRVPGLAAAVEPVLRRALNKQKRAVIEEMQGLRRDGHPYVFPGRRPGACGARGSRR